jgi:SAM-dependent methyltransferase
MTLWSEFLTNPDRVVHKWTHYFPAYEAHFGRYVNRSLLFLEIGIGSGGSLQMWKRYFGPHAQIVGIDIEPRCSEFEEDQIAVRIGDQADPVFLQSVIDEFGLPDIVVDDGSHRMNDIHRTFDFLYPRTSPHGIYLVEDLHTAYWEEFGGGLGEAASFIETSKGLIDELNAQHTRGQVEESEFSRSTLSMHFYDSLVVFERGRAGRKHAPRIGTRAAEWE